VPCAACQLGGTISQLCLASVSLHAQSKKQLLVVPEHLPLMPSSKLVHLTLGPVNVRIWLFN
jgi:hypothetical protein